MVMLFRYGIVAVKRTAKIQLTNQSLFHQNIQIAVHISQTEFRVFLFQVVVHPVGCGMGVRFLKQLENPFALFASLVTLFCFRLHENLKIKGIFSCQKKDPAKNAAERRCAKIV
jgi:hypothetical protein